jgi:hypothetical protein
MTVLMYAAIEVLGYFCCLSNHEQGPMLLQHVFMFAIWGSCTAFCAPLRVTPSARMSNFQACYGVVSNIT